MNNEITCPKCGSTSHHCWDENMEFFEDVEGEIYEAPVAYLKCNNCHAAYLHHDQDATHLGSYADAYGDDS